jgi:hypothetical protein
LIERLIKHAFNFAFDARHTYSHRHIDRFVRPLILVVHQAESCSGKAQGEDEQSKSAAWKEQQARQALLTIDALWLLTKCGHLATYGYGRNHFGEINENQQRRSGHLPAPRWWFAGSHRHVRLIDAGIHYGTEPFIHQQPHALTRTRKHFRP